jgi:hypothetical protein
MQEGPADTLDFRNLVLEHAESAEFGLAPIQLLTPPGPRPPEP